MSLMEQLSEQVKKSLAAHVEIGIGSIGLGIFTSDGRQVGATVQPTSNSDTLEVSDGGETWSDLLMDGYVSAIPSDSVRKKLDALCRTYRVTWDEQRNAIVSMSSQSGFAETARRIAAASIAIDGWRPWFAERGTGERYGEIVAKVKVIGASHHWEMEEGVYVPGNNFSSWRAHAMLRRRGQQAALTFLEERTRESAMQRIAGWMLDTAVPVVFVAHEGVANDLGAQVERSGKAAIVPRRRAGTPQLIVDMVERIAA